MYIPLSFFSTQGSCITATTTNLSGTGSVTTGSFISGGYYWQYYQFNNNAITEEANPENYNVNFTIVSGSTSQAKLFLVGGGGAGGLGAQTICIVSGESTAAGGGGGGGIVYYDNFTLSPGTYQISVGVGGGSPGRPGRQGGNTTFNYSTAWTPFSSSLITAYGGGYGGWVEHYSCGYPDTFVWYQGNSGGSAGGNVNVQGNGLNVQSLPCCNGLGGLNNANQGFAGGYGYNFGNTTNGSGGGGAGGEGQAVDQNYQSTPGYGGPGKSFNLVGTSYTYAAGGGAVRAQGFPVINQSSADGNGTAGIGNGGHASSDYYGHATQGTSGVVIIAWPICASAFSCKNFAITGSGGTISWLPCNGAGYVTQSALIGPGYSYTACLTTFSGSNTPVVLSGVISASSVIGTCDAQFTSSNGCNCESYMFSPNGTQTATWAYCDSNLLTSRSISTSTIFCTNPSIPGQGLTGAGSTITALGICATGSCLYGNTIIQNCDTLVTKSVSFAGTYGYIPTTGNVFKASNTELTGSCWNVIATGTTQSLDYSNVGIYAQYVSCVACSSSLEIDYLVVGGGGAGGYSFGGGGGGGQFISSSTTLSLITSQSFNVVVGAGGPSGISRQPGGTSSFNGDIALGGGQGGYATAGGNQNGASGSSGGGGAYFNNGTGGTGLAGNNGGTGIDGTGNANYSGGGGGANAVGANGSSTSNGGNGKLWLDGNYYAGGGGGYRRQASLSSNGSGGIGGGGAGAMDNNTSGFLRAQVSGSPNTGGGGGGIKDTGLSDGGSGIVKIRYFATGSKATGGTITYSGGYTYHTFTGSGTFTIP